MSNLCVHYKYTYLEAIKHESRVSLSPSFGVKPFCNHWWMILMKIPFDCYWILVGVKVYTLPGNKSILQEAWEFGIISKWKICCGWNNGKDFGNLKSSCVKTCNLIQKRESAIETVYLPPMFWQYIFSFKFDLLKIWKL